MKLKQTLGRREKLIWSNFEKHQFEKCMMLFMGFLIRRFLFQMLSKSWLTVLLTAKWIKSLSLKRIFTIIWWNSSRKWRLVFKHRIRNCSKSSALVWKPKQHLPKRTLALIWIYLQIIGKPIERLLTEKHLWTFDRNDFEKACFCLTFKNATAESSSLEMRELISEHFVNENELTEWSKEIYEKVIFG